MDYETRQRESAIGLIVISLVVALGIISGLRSPQLWRPMGIALAVIFVVVAVLAVGICVSAGADNKKAEREQIP